MVSPLACLQALSLPPTYPSAIIIISHQSLGSTCADPFGNQLAVLREARHAKVQTDLISFLMFQRLEKLSPRDIEKLSNGYIWPASQRSCTGGNQQLSTAKCQRPKEMAH